MVAVGMGDFAVSNVRNTVFATYSLGACVGIAIHDPVAGVGGLLHAMLPDSKVDPAKAAARPGLFIDTGLPAMLQAVCDLGAEKRRVLIHVVGGAQIMGGAGLLNIGKRNHEAVTRVFSQLGLKADEEQVGGLLNRSMTLKLKTGELKVRISGQEEPVALCNN